MGTVTTSSAPDVGAVPSPDRYRVRVQRRTTTAHPPGAVVVADRVVADRVVADEIGPEFAEAPVVASDANLVVVGRMPDGTVSVWRGGLSGLAEVGEVAPAGVELGRIVGLVRYERIWHLFALDCAGGTCHLSSSDLVRWQVRQQFAQEFNRFEVSGVVADAEGVVVAGSVVAGGRRLGWTLLRSSGGVFSPWRLPLSTPGRLPGMVDIHGPVVTDDGQIVLLAGVGDDVMVVWSLAHGWAADAAAPDLRQRSSFVIDTRGDICAGVSYRDHLVVVA